MRTQPKTIQIQDYHKSSHKPEVESLIFEVTSLTSTDGSIIGMEYLY